MLWRLREKNWIGIASFPSTRRIHNGVEKRPTSPAPNGRKATPRRLSLPRVRLTFDDFSPRQIAHILAPRTRDVAGPKFVLLPVVSNPLRPGRSACPVAGPFHGRQPLFAWTPVVWSSPSSCVYKTYFLFPSGHCAESPSLSRHFRPSRKSDARRRRFSADTYYRSRGRHGLVVIFFYLPDKRYENSRNAFSRRSLLISETRDVRPWPSPGRRKKNSKVNMKNTQTVQ